MKRGKVGEQARVERESESGRKRHPEERVADDDRQEQNVSAGEERHGREKILCDDGQIGRQDENQGADQGFFALSSAAFLFASSSRFDSFS